MMFSSCKEILQPCYILVPTSLYLIFQLYERRITEIMMYPGETVGESISYSFRVFYLIPPSKLMRLLVFQTEKRQTHVVLI